MPNLLCPSLMSRYPVSQFSSYTAHSNAAAAADWTDRAKESEPMMELPVPKAGRPSEPGIGTWTPLCIIGGTVTAALLAIAHHLIDTYFNNREVLGFWTQTRTTQLEILLSSAFKIVFCFSAGVSLCQGVWHSMRHQPLPLADIDRLVGEPSLFTLPRINLIFQTPASLLITGAILASPLITVFAPSLTVIQPSATNRTLTVPTLNLSTDAWFDDIVLNTDNYVGPSGTWDKVVLASLTSEDPVGWTIPDGCAPECRYNITYFAPALRCSDLAPDQIDDRVGNSTGLRITPRTFQDPPAAYLAFYDTIPVSAIVPSIVNFTAIGSASNLVSGTDEFTWTLAYLPFSASNSDDGTLINAAGSTCTFYNATHHAQTHFANGTQASSVSVVEFHAPLNTTQRHPGHVFNENGSNALPVVGGVGVAFAPGLGGPLHFFALADAMTARLVGQVDRDIHGTITQTQTLLLETNLFDSPYRFNASTQRFTGLNSSSAITNMSRALENLVANISLSFVHIGTGFTTVEALVPSTHTVYTYNRITLGATYLASFGCLVLISVWGICCLVANGEPSSNTFSQLLLATRNVRLDRVADAVEADPQLAEKSSASLRLMFGEVDVPGRGVRAAFGLVSEQNVEVLRRRR
ncbi:hypothetical protein B0H19DRAFT_577421 [Mycena capillaripes]|nr:hypothetical protein B0H19DRAFT_577421 [Mycena capillaripes]